MKNILLIGAGRFGRHIAMQLSQLGHQVMAVEKANRGSARTTAARAVRASGRKYFS